MHIHELAGSYAGGKGNLCSEECEYDQAFDILVDAIKCGVNACVSLSYGTLLYRMHALLGTGSKYMHIQSEPADCWDAVNGHQDGCHKKTLSSIVSSFDDTMRDLGMMLICEGYDDYTGEHVLIYSDECAMKYFDFDNITYDNSGVWSKISSEYLNKPVSIGFRFPRNNDFRSTTSKEMDSYSNKSDCFFVSMIDICDDKNIRLQNDSKTAYERAERYVIGNLKACNSEEANLAIDRLEMFLNA